jgi:hypothetical protein
LHMHLHPWTCSTKVLLRLSPRSLQLHRPPEHGPEAATRPLHAPHARHMMPCEEPEHSEDRHSSAASMVTDVTDICTIGPQGRGRLTCCGLLVGCNLHRDSCRPPAHCLGTRNGHHRPYLYICMCKERVRGGATT